MTFDDFLKTWDVHPSTLRQRTLLNRIAAALRDTPDCTGAVVVGSFAQGRADRLSDIDLVAFCAEGTAANVFETIRQQIDAKQILMRFDGNHEAASPFQKLILEDFTSIEFHVIAPCTALAIERPYIEIVDRNRYLETRVSPHPAAVEHDKRAYRDGETFLAWELLTCLKWLWRGDFDRAKRYLVRLGRAIEASEPDRHIT